jgi:hypothetical protein
MRLGHLDLAGQRKGRGHVIFTQLHDGNKVTIPETYLSKDCVPGASRILQAGKAGEPGNKNGQDRIGKGNHGEDQKRHKITLYF